MTATGLRGVIITVCLLAIAGSAAAQDAAPITAADWPMYNHDPAGWRFGEPDR